MRRCSRGADVPSVCQTRSLAKVRAQGKPGARCTRSLVCKSKKHTSKSPQVPPDHPAFPARRFDGLFHVLPGDRLYCLRRKRNAKHRRQLDASIGATGPHGFAVRDIYRSSFRYCRAHRIPRPTSVTIAKRPSCGRGTVRILPVIWGDDQLRHIGTTGKSLVAR